MNIILTLEAIFWGVAPGFQLSAVAAAVIAAAARLGALDRASYNAGL